MLPSGEYVFDHVDKGFGADLFRGIDPQRAELYRLCEQKGVGITVMKSLAAGKLLTAEHSPFAKPLTVAQCLHYALSRPAVASVLTGCQTAAEMRDVLSYFDLSPEARDYTEALTSMRNDFKGSCVYCSHCQPCPSGIDIAAVMRLLDTARLGAVAIPEGLRQNYAEAIGQSEPCTKCGNCEARCPFGVPVMENMDEAAGLLG